MNTEGSIQSALRKGRFASSRETKQLDGSPRSRSDGSSTPPHLQRRRVQIPAGASDTREIPARSPNSRKHPKMTKLATKGHGKSGSIQSRTTASSLLLQRWNTTYWLHVYPATIKLFETEQEMEEWKEIDREMNMDVGVGVDVANHEKNNSRQNKLVLMDINFDTEGKLQKKIDNYENSSNKQKKPHGSKVAADTPKCSGLPHKYIMEEVRSKYYSRNGPLIHACKISYLSQTGRTILAAFGSVEPTELKRIRSIIRYCIRLVRKASKSSEKKSKRMSSDSASTFSGMTTGAMSAVSNTQYGEATMTEKTAKKWKKKYARGGTRKEMREDHQSLTSAASKSVVPGNISDSVANAWLRSN